MPRLVAPLPLRGRVLLLVVALVSPTLAALSTTGPAGASADVGSGGRLGQAGIVQQDPVIDPGAAVTYQQNPAHDGSAGDPSFVDPLETQWSVDLGGVVGYPVVAHGRVFVPVAKEGSYGDDLVALSLSTGQVIWGPIDLGGTYWTAMLAYDRGRVFAVNFDGRLAAFDEATGRQYWSIQLPGQYAFTSPPTAVGGVLYVGGAGSGGTLYAVDERDGSVLWTAGVANGDSSSPAVGEGGVFVSYACLMAYRFSLSGSLVWNHRTGCTGGGGRTPVLHDGKLYARDSSGRESMILDATTGARLGTFDSWVAPAFDDDAMVTLIDETLTVTDLDSGQVRWRNAGEYVVAPLIVNGYVIVGREDGTVELRDEHDGSLVWSGSAGNEILPIDEHNARTRVGMAVGDGALVVPAGELLTVFAPTDAPRAHITSGPADGDLTGPRVTFTFESSVEGAGFICYLDGVPTACTSPVAYAGLSEGEHTFGVTLTSSASSPRLRTFEVEATRPTVRLRRFTPFAASQPRRSIAWVGADASGISHYQVRGRQGPRGTALPPWSIPVATLRTEATFVLRRNHRLCLQVRAVDTLGNTSAWSTSQCAVRFVHRR